MRTRSQLKTTGDYPSWALIVRPFAIVFVLVILWLLASWQLVDHG
jgi:hypothetical protein